MFVIAFEKNNLLGGYGDRIVGLISVKLISKLLNRKFSILWTKEDIKEYIDYSKYDFELIGSDTNVDGTSRTYTPTITDNVQDVLVINSIDNQKYLKDYLINNHPNNLFPNIIQTENGTHTINKYFFKLNQEISQYLFKNKYFENSNFFKHILHEYETLYSDVLKLTPSSHQKVENILKHKTSENIVGVQIRCGDTFMKTNKNEVYRTNNENNIEEKLRKINKICSEKFNDYNIFFTTDNINILGTVEDIFGKNNVLYNYDEIQHLDRKSINDDISKVFIDNFILSQRTRLLFISFNSNYGRISGLSCHHGNVYDFSNCKKLEKQDMLSKHEMLF